MCIRITKELKTVYELVEKIDLSKKIDKVIFTKILRHLGYIDHGQISTEPLVDLAWRTIRTKADKEEILTDAASV